MAFQFLSWVGLLGISFCLKRKFGVLLADVVECRMPWFMILETDSTRVWKNEKEVEHRLPTILLETYADFWLLSS